MIRVGTSSRQLADIHNSDQLLHSVAASEEITTQAAVALVVLVVAVHIRMALQEQEL